MLWAIILGVGLFFLPESPRYLVKKGRIEEAAVVLSKVRGQPVDSVYVRSELAEIVGNFQHEMEVITKTSYLGSWTACFKGSIRDPNSNLRRTLLGTLLQMMSQWTGVNFVFYYGELKCGCFCLTFG
jgi:hypothetical protein